MSNVKVLLLTEGLSTGPVLTPNQNLIHDISHENFYSLELLLPILPRSGISFLKRSNTVINDVGKSSLHPPRRALTGGPARRHPQRYRWIRMWVCRELFAVKDLPQISHVNGFSPKTSKRDQGNQKVRTRLRHRANSGSHTLCGQAPALSPCMVCDAPRGSWTKCQV